MSEALRTRVFLTAVRRTHPDAFVWKISDRVTGGIPDALITKDGRTIFIEFKKGNPANVAKLVRPLQLHQIRKLVDAGAKVYICVFTKDGYKVFNHDLLPSPQGQHELDYLAGFA
jgi:phospholipase/lecithinase/hemolysin